MKISMKLFRPHSTSVIKRFSSIRFLIKHTSFSILVAALLINCLTPNILVAQQKKQHYAGKDSSVIYPPREKESCDRDAREAKT